MKPGLKTELPSSLPGSKCAVQVVAGLAAIVLLASCGDKDAQADGEAKAVTGTEVQKAPGRVGLSPAENLLRKAHYLTAWTDRDVTGKLRSEDRSIAIGVYRRGDDAQIAYRNPEEGGPVRIHSRLVDDRYEMYEIVGGKTWRCTPGRLVESVGGTNFTHEDLLMPWLFWPDAEMAGEEEVMGKKRWKIRVENPEPRGQYRFVQVWVHQEHGGLVQAVGYDADGRPIKRFKVTDVQRAGRWGTGDIVFRRGRLDRIDPEANEVVEVSYIEFDRPSLVGAAD